MKKLRILVMLALSVVMLTQCEGGIGGDIGSDSGNNGGNTEEPIEPNEPDEPEEPEDPSQGNYEYVDLGLPSGLKWATCNVGANSPEEYGDYFAWGETQPKDSYDVDNSVTFGVEMGDISGNAQYDAARANWGEPWRMPTEDEMRELRDECTWIWKTLNGVNGYEVVGPNGKTIFLPAAGGRDGTSLNSAGEGGYYWSSSPYESNTNFAYYLYFSSSRHGMYNYGRILGFTVRPVSE